LRHSRLHPTYHVNACGWTNPCSRPCRTAKSSSPSLNSSPPPVCVGNGSFVYDALYDNPPECRSPAPTRLVSIRQTPTSERVKSSRVRQDGRQTPAAGDTNSRKWLQVAGIQVVPVVPLDQESPGSSPGGATRLPRCGSRFFSGARPRPPAVGLGSSPGGATRSAMLRSLSPAACS